MRKNKRPFASGGMEIDVTCYNWYPDSFRIDGGRFEIYNSTMLFGSAQGGIRGRYRGHDVAVGSNTVYGPYGGTRAMVKVDGKTYYVTNTKQLRGDKRVTVENILYGFQKKQYTWNRQ